MGGFDGGRDLTFGEGIAFFFIAMVIAAYAFTAGRITDVTPAKLPAPAPVVADTPGYDVRFVKRYSNGCVLTDVRAPDPRSGRVRAFVLTCRTGEGSGAIAALP